jgi:hypothetical protein
MFQKLRYEPSEWHCNLNTAYKILPETGETGETIWMISSLYTDGMQSQYK